MLPISEMFTSLAELMGKGAFIPMGVEIVANSSAVLELGAIRESFIMGSFLPNVEKPHLEAPIQKFLPWRLSTWVVATMQLVPSAFIGSGTDLVSTLFDGLGSAGFVGKPALGASTKRLFANAGMFWGMEFLSMCSNIFSDKL